MTSVSDHPQADGALRFLRRDGLALGTVLSVADPVLAERVAASFDFVWIDMEHSALGIREVQLLAIAVRAGGAAAFVRVPRWDSELLTAVMDAGPAGVVVPRIGGLRDAELLAAATTYPPAGARGYAPRRGTVDRAPGDAAGGVAAPLARVLQIETRGALEAVEEIAALDGIDGLVVGTSDLALELGGRLDPDSPAIVAAIERVGAAARRERKAWGVAVGRVPDWLPPLLGDDGMLVFSSDFRLYADAIEHSASELRALSGASA